MNHEHVSDYLDLGADGVVMGTRFMCTQESLIDQKRRKFLMENKERGTIRTRVFDALQDTIPWPVTVNGRALSTPFITENHSCAKERKLDGAPKRPELRDKLVKAIKEGDFTLAPIFCGQNIGLVSETETSATEVVQQIIQHLEKRGKLP